MFNTMSAARCHAGTAHTRTRTYTYTYAYLPMPQHLHEPVRRPTPPSPSMPAIAIETPWWGPVGWIRANLLKPMYQSICNINTIKKIITIRNIHNKIEIFAWDKKKKWRRAKIKTIRVSKDARCNTEIVFEQQRAIWLVLLLMWCFAQHSTSLMLDYGHLPLSYGIYSYKYNLRIFWSMAINNDEKLNHASAAATVEQQRKREKWCVYRDRPYLILY